MKYMDKVKVANSSKIYQKQGVFKDMIGTIIDPEIRNNCFNVIFIDERVNDQQFMKKEKNFLSLNDDIICPIKIKDLIVIKNNNYSDDLIFDALPSPDKRWWYKVEDGYIINFLGERKNKIPYNYDS